MAYTALYRKFRPGVFEDVKGQDHIVKALRNQITSDRIGHAYLFCGTRGTGKTSVAKLFAKAVNCESPVNGSPCGQCKCCQDIAAGRSMNVVEIDAASNNGVDNVREIIQEVTYAPTEGKFKVYIIDEVHGLSGGAFNALLKTLEEPPAYVIFILATTEIHKVPATIMSRCQRYDFHRISIDTITARLSELMSKEGINAEEKGLRYIAKVGDGSLRDSLSLLEQCLGACSDGNLTYDGILETLGVVDTVVFENLLDGVLAADSARCIKAVEDIVIEGRDLTQFVLDFTWYMRNLLLLKADGSLENILDISSDNLATMRDKASGIDGHILTRYIELFSSLSDEMRYSGQKRILLEIALIRLCVPKMDIDYNALLHRIEMLEDRFVKGGVSVVPTAVERGEEPAPAGVDPEISYADRPPIPEATPDEIKQICANWTSLINSNRKKFHGYLSTALLAAYVTVGEDCQIVLQFSTDKELEYRMLCDLDNKQEIEKSLSYITGYKFIYKPVLNTTGKSNEAVAVNAEAFFKNQGFSIDTEDF